MPKRTLTDEQKKVRNEKARRKRALAFACRRVPIELEREIFSYMKDPDNGRIDVAMKWQQHPVAKLFRDAPDVLRIWRDGRGVSFCVGHHGQSYITHLAQTLAKHRGYVYSCKRIFTFRMQLTIARKAFEIAFRDILNFDASCYQKKTCLCKLDSLLQFGDWCSVMARCQNISGMMDWDQYCSWIDWNFQTRGALTSIRRRLLSNPGIELHDLKMALQDLDKDPAR